MLLYDLARHINNTSETLINVIKFDTMQSLYIGAADALQQYLNNAAIVCFFPSGTDELTIYI
jgi:hypothetical protein